MKQWFIDNWGILFSGIGTFLLGLIITNLKKIIGLISRSKRDLDLIKGKWIATFSYDDNNTKIDYTEVIQLDRKWNNYIGKIIPDSRNYERLQLTHKTKPKRVKGEFFENKLFSGIWFHPIEKNRWIGSFQLTLIDKNTLKGIYTGWSESKKEIVSGDWMWIRETN